MKKVLVAGAGHGGLVTAYHLAQNGFQVTVVEQKARNELGYDWKDCVPRNVFTTAGLPTPADVEFGGGGWMGYFNPKKNMPVVREEAQSLDLGYIDRQYLIDYLLTMAEGAGVQFRFGCSVACALTRGDTVVGLALSDGEKLFADLVIDAAGVSSPVRWSLPLCTDVPHDIRQEDTFYVWRGYFEKACEDMEEPTQRIFFYHCGRRGMDWCIAEKDYMDILVGGFGELTQAQMEEAVADFRTQYPAIGQKLVRGGSFEKISLRRPLSMMVCNGYAAVGESACMTEPLSGSGVGLSMVAGKMLADTVLTCEDFTKAELWPYEYAYFQEAGERCLSDDILKGLLSKATAEDMDYLFEKKILTVKELASAGQAKYTLSELLGKGYFVLKNPAIIRLLVDAGLKLMKLQGVCRLMPKEYNDYQFRTWKKQYESL